MVMTTYDETAIATEVRVIGALARGLHEFLSGLSADDLRRQSACDAWTVRDVAGHLANRAERQIASMTRGRHGDSGAPVGFSAPSGNMAMSAANADADIAYAESMGDDLLPTYEQHYRALHGLLAGFSGDDWRCDCWHPRRGTMTAREYVSQRIQELAVHDWDIRSAFDVDAALQVDARPVLLGMTAHWLRSAYNPANDSPSEPVRYRFDLSDAPALDVVVGADGAEVGSNLHADAAAMDLLVSCDSNTYLLLAYGRLDLDAAIAAGRFQVTQGSDALLRRFAAWMVGF
jgi:uncharacterized protein (TIGR03083 family)